ncbi:MAG: hypothetical protein JW839_00185 [Candidatus Lokiarchaeota archaeon]|nr:hypothetical protein [Candidatus Lokiarchaeota archaeon]
MGKKMAEGGTAPQGSQASRGPPPGQAPPGLGIEQAMLDASGWHAPILPGVPTSAASGLCSRRPSPT